jgi:hypothetical protein
MPSTRRTSLVKRNESSTGRRSSNASSDGSCVQPSMGIPFTVTLQHTLVYEQQCERPKKRFTHSHLRYSKSANCRRGRFARGLAQRVRDSSCMIRLVAGYRTASNTSGENSLSTKMIKDGQCISTYLAKEPASENVLPSIKPINDRICVLFHRCRKNHERIPRGHLVRSHDCQRRSTRVFDRHTLRRK